MKKINDLRNEYYASSKTLSDLNRKLAFAGIAVVWIFKNESGAIEKVPKELVLPALLFTLSLFCDLSQYLVKSIILSSYARHMEKKHHESEWESKTFTLPPQINWPTLLFFYSKVCLATAGYLFLIQFLYTKVFS